MSMSRNEGRSLVIRPGDCPLWMRVYRRRDRFFALLNFLPSAYPSFVDGMERLVKLEHVANYPDAVMGAVVFGGGRGLPVASIHELLVRTAGEAPVPVVHVGTRKEESHENG